MDRLPELVEVWQQRMGLADWTILIRVVESLPDFKGAEVEFCRFRRRAIIRIVDPETSHGHDDEKIWILGRPDPERLVVHELCHLVLCSIGDEYQDEVELAIHRLEYAFMAAGGRVIREVEGVSIQQWAEASLEVD